jgi:hypothetical protein
MTDAGSVLALTGSNFIGSRESRETAGGFRTQDPSTGDRLGPAFAEATPSEVEELRGPSPRRIWRLADGRPTRESL